MPPRVFVRYDVDNWCFGRIAGWIKRRLSDEFEILLGSGQDPLPAAFDVYLGFSFAAVGDFRVLPANARLVICVYDHFLWRDHPRSTEKARSAARIADMLLFANSKLADEMAAYVDLPPLSGVCEDGVDAELFVPRPKPPRKSGDPLLVIGWTGSKTCPVKGWQIIQRAANLKWCELRTAAREDRWRAHEEMPAYYADLDVYMSASSCEGTPNPILEASACGVPWVSTDVGIVRDLFRSAPSPPGFIVPRDDAYMSDALLRLRDDPALRARMGAAGRVAVEAAWTWPRKVEAFRAALREVLRRPPRRAGA